MGKDLAENIAGENAHKQALGIVYRGRALPVILAGRIILFTLRLKEPRRTKATYGEKNEGKEFLMLARIRRIWGAVRAWIANLLDALRDSSDIPGVLALVWLLIAIGLLSLLIPAVARWLSAGPAAALTVLGAGLFLAGASTVTGSLVGFMFGVPRYRRDDKEARSGDAATVPNTNLEQISDWLTKIIVGVGLTQIPAIGHFFENLGSVWGSAFGDPPAGQIIALCITIHYLVMGFFQGFLLSSLWLPGAFDRAQRRNRSRNERSRVQPPDAASH